MIVLHGHGTKMAFLADNSDVEINRLLQIISKQKEMGKNRMEIAKLDKDIYMQLLSRGIVVSKTEVVRKQLCYSCQLFTPGQMWVCNFRQCPQMVKQHVWVVEW